MMKNLWLTKAQKFIKIIGILFIVLLILLFFLSRLGSVAQATGLVDNTVDSAHAYSRYPLENYSLDFYVDNSWNWLPWNWTDGIGQQVMYGLYTITHFIWMVNLYVSYATGSLIQEAYALDFISDTAEAIGENMQILAGVTRAGFSSEGFYVGFLLLLVLVIGIYVTYTGLLKREATKAIQGVLNFLIIFLLSSAFIAYAPDTIQRINEFSSDISEASLSLGTRMSLPDSETQGSESVDLIRDSLFSIQVRQPWVLLQYGTNDEEAIGTERIETLLSTSPTENAGETREQIVIEEIEQRNNPHLTINQTINRLGVVSFISIFNIGISLFVFLLTGIMIFSQVLFIIYAMFLPISFLLSMIPSFGHLSKRALTKLFNTILARAGITLILTIAFSLSSMLYTLSAGYPFFLIAFLQIVTFAGIYVKLGDLMGMFALQSSDSQNMSKQVMRKPRSLMHTHRRRLQGKLLAGSLGLLGAGKAAVAYVTKKGTSNEQESRENQRPSAIPSSRQPTSNQKQNGHSTPVHPNQTKPDSPRNKEMKQNKRNRTVTSVHRRPPSSQMKKKEALSQQNKRMKYSKVSKEKARSHSTAKLKKEQFNQGHQRKMDKTRKPYLSNRRTPSALQSNTSTRSNQPIKNQLRKQKDQNKPLIKREHRQISQKPNSMSVRKRPVAYKRPPTSPPKNPPMPPYRRKENQT